MTTAPAFWRRSEMAAAQTTTLHRPETNNALRAATLFLLSLLFLGSFVAPLAANAQNLGTAPQFGQAVQGQQATTVEGTVLNIVNWGCNVIAPVIAVACLGMTAIAASRLVLTRSSGAGASDPAGLALAAVQPAWSQLDDTGLDNARPDGTGLVSVGLNGASRDHSSPEVSPPEPSPADISPTDIGPSDVSPADVSPSDVSPADVSPADMSPADMGPSDVSPADMSPADVSPSDVSPADISPGDMSPADISGEDVTQELPQPGYGDGE